MECSYGVNAAAVQSATCNNCYDSDDDSNDGYYDAVGYDGHDDDDGNYCYFDIDDDYDSVGYDVNDRNNDRDDDYYGYSDDFDCTNGIEE